MDKASSDISPATSSTDRKLIEKLKVDGKRLAEKEQRKFAPETIIDPLFHWVGAGPFLDSEPPPVQWLLKDLLPAGIVGSIFAAGGTGKTFLALHLACAMAANQPFGPFRPVRPLRVLYIGGEDPKDELHRRIRRVAEGMDLMTNYNLRQNLNAVSLVGTDRILIELQEGNPRVTKTYTRLQKTIIEAGTVDMIMIDPMSRFFGLNENDNNHATAWISCLERLAREHNTTVLFCHHESKATIKDGNVKTSAGRGASAIRDGIRWSLSLGELGEKTAQEFDVNSHEYLEMYTSKSNYSARWSGTEFFRRRGDGTLEPANLRSDRRKRQVELLVEVMAKKETEGGEEVTRRDLRRSGNSGRGQSQNPTAKAIIDALKEEFPSFSARNEIDIIVAKAIEEGVITEDLGKRKTLQVAFGSRR